MELVGMNVEPAVAGLSLGVRAPVGDKRSGNTASLADERMDGSSTSAVLSTVEACDVGVGVCRARLGTINDGVDENAATSVGDAKVRAHSKAVDFMIVRRWWTMIAYKTLRLMQYCKLMNRRLSPITHGNAIAIAIDDMAGWMES